jgi:hypothetical protein
MSLFVSNTAIVVGERQGPPYPHFLEPWCERGGVSPIGPPAKAGQVTHHTTDNAMARQGWGGIILTCYRKTPHGKKCHTGAPTTAKTPHGWKTLSPGWG